MKYFGISLFLISFVGFIIPQAFSAEENFFYGTATFERLSSTIVSNTPTEFEIKFHYTAGSYALKSLTPVIEVNPEGARSKVHFDIKPVNAYQNDIVRIPVTITVDPSIEYEKIFLSISYAGIGLHNVPFKSSWSDSIIFDVDHACSKPSDFIRGAPCGFHSSVDGKDSDSPQGIWGGFVEIPKLSPPLQQFKSRTPIEEILCKENLQLMVKTSNGNPACVRQETMQKLIERGWGTKLETTQDSKTSTKSLDKNYTLQINDNIFEIRYSIIGSLLQEIIVDIDAKSLIVNVEGLDNGHMVIEIPRKLIDARVGPDGKSGEDVDFFVLVDGSEVDFEENSSTDTRTLTIPLKNGSSQIEIIGTIGHP
jgi:hypothetical protein